MGFEFIDSKPKEWYHERILQLIFRWHQTIEHDGLYLDY